MMPCGHAGANRREERDEEAVLWSRARRAWRFACRRGRGPGDQGRDRAFGLDRLRAADARQGGRHLQEARPRRRRSRRSRRRTATSRSRRATSSAPRRRSRPGSSGTPNGVATKQIFQLDKSYGADGMAVRANIAKIADLKGKTVAASAPGTAPYFTLAWFLKKNGLSVKDVTVVNLEPGPAAQAFIAGQNDAAMTYEPYLSTVRDSAAGRQDHRHHARLPDDHGHVRLHAEVPRRQPEGREGARRQLFRGGRDDQARSRRRATRSWAPT